LPVILEAKNLLPFINNDLALVLNPVQFRVKKGGVIAEGLNAEALPKVLCFMDMPIVLNQRVKI